MLQLCYASHATQGFDSPELEELLRKARSNNERIGVSGLLLYENRCFLQVLEGDSQRLMPLYEKIQRDPRHNQFLLIFKQEIGRPSFENWRMGFFHADRKAVSQLPGYHNFFTKSFSVAAFAQDADRARQIFLQFREGQWRRHVSAA